MSTANCKTCLAPIIFVRLDSGKIMPIDHTPNPAGNVAVYFGPSGLPRTAYVLSKDKPLIDGYTLHMPHHATCPNWRSQ
jgi:hypothetical protein